MTPRPTLEEKMRKILIAVAVLGIVACEGANDTNLTGTTEPEIVVSQASQPATAETSVKIWKTGAIDVTGDVHKQACYFKFGPHEQELLASFVIDGPGHYDAPKLPKDTCVQVDVADNCNRSSIMPGLIAVEYVGPCDPPVCEGDECQCQPGEIQVVSSETIEGEWGSCDLGASNGGERCSECRRNTIITTLTDGCKTWKEEAYETEERETECPKVGVCHVSNKGHDGDVELVVTYKRNGEGHIKHMDPDKYCPTDKWAPMPPYLGESKRRKFECKLEGPGSEENCNCETFLEEVKTCWD